MGCSSSTAEALFTAEEPIDSADDDKDILKKYLTAALAKNPITKSIMESWVSDETDKFLSLGKLMVLKPNAGCVDHTNMLIERGITDFYIFSLNIIFHFWSSSFFIHIQAKTEKDFLSSILEALNSTMVLVLKFLTYKQENRLESAVSL